MIIAIIQARMSSTRLPNKVLKTIANKPMLQLQIERIKTAKLIDKIVVATSNQSEDDAIAQLCQQLDISCFRGSLNDVLARYYYCANQYNTTHIVRLTADCPLTDASIIDQVIHLHIKTQSDYTSNCSPASLPDGLDVEVFTKKALTRAFNQARIPAEREHITLYFRNNNSIFNNTNFKHSPNLSHLRWTVDESEDFDFVKQVYQYLYTYNPHFSTDDILNLLNEHPELSKINQNFQRDEGLLKSIKNDKENGFE